MIKRFESCAQSAFTLRIIIVIIFYCCSCINTTGLRVPTKHIRYFSTFKTNGVSRLSPILRCVKATNYVCKFLDIFNQQGVSLVDTPSGLILVTS
jgi:hypothetical protein